MNISIFKKYGLFNLDVNISIKKGEILGIVGRSGSGKSTILKTMQGIISYDKGDLTSISNLKKSYIFQNFNLLNNLTVFENVALPLKLKKQKDDEFITKLLEFTFIENKKDLYVSQLSGGEKQRVSIARALACKPDLLLCDEFSSSLDDLSKNEILNLFKMINEKYAITIILVTHELDVIKKICDRIYVIEKGKILEEIKINKSNDFKNYDTYLSYVKDVIK